MAKTKDPKLLVIKTLQHNGCSDEIILYFCLCNQEAVRHVLNPSGALDERVEDEEDNEEDLVRMHRHYRRTEEGGRPGGSHGRANNRELTQNEIDQVRHHSL